jgi:hypothetical protein
MTERNNNKIADSQNNKNIHLYQRELTADHSDSIRSSSEIKSAKATQIIDDVFKHFPAAFCQEPPDFYKGRPYTNKAPNKANKNTQPSADWLGHIFYNEFYTPVNIRRGVAGTGSIISTEEFIEEITASNANNDRNFFHFLVGEIGDGKTAFINSLITTRFADNWFDSSFWFIRLNPDYQTFVEHNTDHQARQKAFFSAFFSRLQFVFEEIVLYYSRSRLALNEEQIGVIRDILIKADESRENKLLDSELRQYISEAVNKISALLNKKFLLIIDNLDSFFHEHDRYIFINRDGTGEDESIQYITEILLKFFHVASSIGRLGSDILIVVRPDSYQVMKKKRHLFRGFDACFDQDRNAYNIAPPSWREIIRQRLFMLEKIAYHLTKTKSNKDICSHISALLEDLDISVDEETKGGDIFEDLQQLSNQGVRSVVDFFSMYAWLPNNNEVRRNLTQRYINHQPVGLMAYMIHNKKLFSQHETMFPNIFMINAEAFGDLKVITKLAGNQFKIQHRHSYWLKFLLLKYLYHLNFTDPEAITVDTIMDTFCGNQDTIRKSSFDEGIVRIILGSFAQAHNTNLITVARKITPNNHNTLLTGEIKLTKRGECLIEKHVFTFPYLQLVVDDNYMKLPRCCKDFFKYKLGMNYVYLVQPKEDYMKSVDNMLLQKIPVVGKFIALLQATYDIEKEVYKDVFDKLQIYGVPLLNKDDIKLNFLEELKAISNKKEMLFKDNDSSIGLNSINNLIDKHYAQFMSELKCIYQ